MPPIDKPGNDDKKVISVASDLAVQAMQTRMWEANKPEEIADFCLAVAARIFAYDDKE